MGEAWEQNHKELACTCCSLIIVVLTGYSYSTACISVCNYWRPTQILPWPVVLSCFAILRRLKIFHTFVTNCPLCICLFFSFINQHCKFNTFFSNYCRYQLFTLNMVNSTNLSNNYSTKGEMENTAHCQPESHVTIMQLAWMAVPSYIC